MNHIVRGRLLINVTLAAVLLGLLFVISREAQAAAWPISAVVVLIVAVNVALQVRTGAQVAELRAAMSRLVGGELEEPVPLGADEPLGSMAELMERLRKILFQRQQDLSRQLGVQSKTSGDLGNVLSDLRNTIGQQMHALEETSASLHEMTTSAKQIAQSVETLARGAEESSSSILEMAASNDEVAENMVNLAGAVQESATSIEEMTYSIREVAKNVEALSATAEETSSSMNEMDISIRQVENNANETARLSEEVSRAAGLGAQAITSTIDGMNKIKGYSEGTVRVIARLGDKIGEIDKIDAKKVTRVVLCSGKVYYDLLAARRERKIANIAIVRIEQLYPFPSEPLVARLKRMSNLEEVVWAQEEPKNNGSWFFVEPFIEECLEQANIGPARARYAGRKASAATATGLMKRHQAEQAALVADALGHNVRAEIRRQRKG